MTPQNDTAAEYVSPKALAQKLECDKCALLLDVRAPEELHGELGHLPQVTNIPLSQLAHRLSELAGYEERDIAVVCRTGKRSEAAARTLRERGFTRVSVLTGGMIAWRAVAP